MQRGLRGNFGDLQLGELTAVADGAVVTLATLEFEGDDLLILELGDDFGRDTRPGNEGGAEGDLITVHDEQHFADRGFCAGFDSELFDVQEVSLGDAVLLAAGLDDCVGHRKSLEKGE